MRGNARKPRTSKSTNVGKRSSRSHAAEALGQLTPPSASGFSKCPARSLKATPPHVTIDQSIRSYASDSKLLCLGSGP
jgi:hypothetical protein